MICPKCGFNNKSDLDKCTKCDTKLEDIELLEDYDFDVNTTIDESNNKKVIDKKLLLKICSIISIILPLIVIILYFMYDIPTVIGIIICSFSYIIGSLNDDKNNKLVITGRVLSAANAGFLFLEFLLYIFDLLFGI